MSGNPTGEHKIKEIKSGNTNRIGILNTDKRLKLFFGNEYGLTIEGKENEYTPKTCTKPYKEQIWKESTVMN